MKTSPGFQKSWKKAGDILDGKAPQIKQPGAVFEAVEMGLEIMTPVIMQTTTEFSADFKVAPEEVGAPVAKAMIEDGELHDVVLMRDPSKPRTANLFYRTAVTMKTPQLEAKQNITKD